MCKKILVIVLLTISFSACKKNNGKSACGTQMCTESFASFGITFTDNQGKPAALKDTVLLNLRTGKVMPPVFATTANFVPGFVLVATDAIKKEFSAEGDDVRVSATSVATGQTKQVVVKISGGCNCHIDKVSGPETVKFD